MPDKGGHGSVPPTYSQAVGEWEDGSRPGPSPFNVAARRGDLDEIKRLIANGGNMFATGEIGQTPAYSAAVTGHTEILEYLIQHGADYTAGNEDGFTPLNAAATKNYPETLLLLLRYGADPNAPTVDGQTPVWSAANEGHLDTVRVLVEHGVNFSHCRNDGGFTPVCVAASEGHADIVQFLTFAMPSARLSLEGTEIFYSVQGPDSGIPVLLIHGWTCDMTDWVYQSSLLLLAHTVFRVISFDLRGHGRSLLHSTTNTPVVDPITMASDSTQLLEHLGVGPGNKAIVMGHSLGGTIATELAASRPDLVRGTVLVDPSYYMTPGAIFRAIDFMKPNFQVGWAAYFGSLYPPGTPDWIKEWHKLRAWAMETSVAMSTLEQMGENLGPSGAAYLRQKKMEIPRLVVAASNTSLDIEKEAGIDEKFDTIEAIETTHWVMKSEPEKFNAVLETWLKAQGFTENE
ncbi:hypothetical protein ACO1O0_007951 [Amphichorda felina]